MTTDGASTCPGTEQIELLAQGEAAPAMVLDHVAQCAVCSARLAAAKEDASFLARVRQLTSDELGPAGAPNIAGYRVAGTLGAGAQGVVYKAIQESTARTVAIKVMTPGVSQSPKQRFRAEREVEIAARLTHPNIVTVFESRTLWDGRLAVVMEYVDGMRMDTWARSGQVDRQDVLRAFVALCKGVHHAHLNGVIHRDLKPANVLVTPEGRPVVLDFGIAKLAGMQATLTGEFAGTPAYASPEQVRGKPDEIDGLSDVYSLGVMLYQALSGQMPYDTQGSILDIAKSIESSIPTGLARHVPGIPPDVEAIVMRALRKDKAERYQSAAGLARDIERYLSGAPVEARSTSRWYVLRKALALNKRRLAWIGVGVVAVAGAVLVVGLSLRQAAAAEREAALRERQAHDENVRARAVQELLRETFPVDDPNRPEVADAVRAGLMRLYFRLETGGFANDPQLDHTLRRMWGEIYTGIGAGEQAGLVEYAEVSLRSGLERLLEEHVGDHPDVAATMHDLAGVLYVRKRLPEADALCARALAMRERLFGNTGEAVASSLSLAAQIHVEQGRLDEARTEGDRALQILESLSGTDADIAIARLHAMQGHIALKEGRGEQASALIRDGLVRRLRWLPPDDRDVLASLDDAAELAQQFPAAPFVAELCTAWDVSAEALPAQLRADAKLMIVPGLGFAGTPRMSGGTRAYERLSNLTTILFGADDLARVQVLLAWMRAAESEGLQRTRATAALETARVLEKHHGPNDRTVLVCLDEAALVLAYSGDAQAAAEIALRTTAVQEDVPEDVRDPVTSANKLRVLAWYLTMAHRCTEAKPIWERSIRAFRAVFEGEHYVVALAESGYAMCLCEEGNLQEADRLTARALDIAEGNPRVAGDQLAHIRLARGHVLLALGRGGEAIPVLEGAWHAMYEKHGSLLPWKVLVMEDLAAACEHVGDRYGAADWRDRIAKLNQ